jgi:alkylhydroperoxidase family enzyme
VGREDADLLRSHGWSDVAIHDAIQVISYFNYVNRIAEAVGIEDEPEWDAKEHSVTWPHGSLSSD